MNPYILSLFTGCLAGILSIFLLTFIITKGKGIIEFWQETMPIMLGILGVGIIIHLLGTLIILKSSTSYKEILNYKVVEVRYFEDWNELVTYTENHYDSKGNLTYVEVKTRVDYHGPDWEGLLDNGDEIDIEESEYERYKREWNNSTFVELSRSYYTDDGDEYISKWNGNFINIFPHQEINTYENRIRASKSIFNKYTSVDDSLKKLYKHPVYDKSTSNTILNFCKYPVTTQEAELLAKENASLGNKYQVHSILALFDGNKSVQCAEDMMNAWVGPNKNELVTCVGVTKTGDVSWCRVYSWMDNTYIHTHMRQEITKQKFSIATYDRILYNSITEFWHRKHFSDFDYIDVSLGIDSVFIIFIISLIILNVVGFFIITNQ